MYIINQKRKRIVNHFSSQFYHSHQSCTCIYIKNIMWNRGLVQAGNHAAETKKTKMRVVVHCRDNICSEINRCLDNMLQHISIKIDNLHKLYFKFSQRSAFLVLLTIFVHFCIFKKGTVRRIYTCITAERFKIYHSFLFTFWRLLLTTSTIKIL